MLAEDTDADGGGGGGGPITAEDEIPDKEAIDDTEDRPIRCAMALLFPSFFKSCAACRRISAAWPLKTVRCYNMTYMSYDVYFTSNCPCHFFMYMN